LNALLPFYLCRKKENKSKSAVEWDLNPLQLLHGAAALEGPILERMCRDDREKESY